MILIFAVLGCLGLFGVSVTSFAAVIAASAFAIGLAFQGSLSNFSAGVMLLNLLWRDMPASIVPRPPA